MRCPRTAVVLFGTFLAAAFAAPAVASDIEAVVARGKALFADASLGTNGKSCATCHGEGKVWAGKSRFPKVALGGTRTLDQAIQICVTNALAGTLLPWDDERLSALAVFVDRLYTPAAR